MHKVWRHVLPAQLFCVSSSLKFHCSVKLKALSHADNNNGSFYDSITSTSCPILSICSNKYFNSPMNWGTDFSILAFVVHFFKTSIVHASLLDANMFSNISSILIGTPIWQLHNLMALSPRSLTDIFAAFFLYRNRIGCCFYRTSIVFLNVLLIHSLQILYSSCCLPLRLCILKLLAVVLILITLKLLIVLGEVRLRIT